MIRSTKYAWLALRLGLAAVFFWFGIEKILYPQVWATAWLPDWTAHILQKISITPVAFMYLNGIFEILVGISLVANVFTRIFSLLAVVFLMVLIASVGFTEGAIRDIGLIGGLIAVFLWPERE